MICIDVGLLIYRMILVLLLRCQLVGGVFPGLRRFSVPMIDDAKTPVTEPSLDIVPTTREGLEATDP